MIDPKMLSYPFMRDPILLTEVVTDMKDAANALQGVGEMERRTNRCLCHS